MPSVMKNKRLNYFRPLAGICSSAIIHYWVVVPRILAPRESHLTHQIGLTRYMQRQMLLYAVCSHIFCDFVEQELLTKGILSEID
jgi:hypothetical protein